MFAARGGSSRRVRDEAEKPFWISYADLMTALMVLFLVVMSVALLAVTKEITEEEKRETQRHEAIESCLSELAAAARSFDGVSVDRIARKINFGTKARFDKNSAALTEENREALQAFVPLILDMANQPCGKRWLRRVVVEGFADRTGTYLYNLDLSLRRSQSVICTLVDAGSGLPMDQRKQIRDLFLVGGYSFNMEKSSPEESRRIEFRLEFFGLEEEPTLPSERSDVEFGRCQIR